MAIVERSSRLPESIALYISDKLPTLAYGDELLLRKYLGGEIPVVSINSCPSGTEETALSQVVFDRALAYSVDPNHPAYCEHGIEGHPTFGLAVNILRAQLQSGEAPKVTYDWHGVNFEMNSSPIKLPRGYAGRNEPYAVARVVISSLYGELARYKKLDRPRKGLSADALFMIRKLTTTRLITGYVDLRTHGDNSIILDEETIANIPLLELMNGS